MSEENDLSGKVGLDTTGFKAGVNDINAMSKSIESSFRATAAVMGDWSNKSEGLTLRISSLSEKLDLQKQKLSILSEEYKKAVTEQGASSSAAASLANQMYSAEKAISSTETDIKKYNSALESMNSDESKATEETKKLDSALDSTGKTSGTAGEKIKSSMSSLGSGVATGVRMAGTAIVGMATAAVAAGAGVFEMANKSGEAASQLKVMSEKTGMTTDKLQEYQFTADKLGISLDTITGVQSKLVKNMSAAQSGTKAQADAFKTLGVAVTDSSGHLRNQNEVFTESITALGKVSNETERNALSMKLFGKSATDLNPLINAGGDALAQYSKEAENSGAVMSEASINGLAKFKDGMAGLKDSLSGMSGTLAALALPALNQFKDLIQGLSGALNTALKTGDFSQFGTVLSTGMSSAVGKLSGMVTKLVPIITQVLNSLIGAIVTAIPTILPALTTGVVQIFNALVQILQTNGPMLITAGVQAIVTLVSGFAQALPQIMTAAVSLITTLAGSISDQLPTLIPIAINAIITIVNGLLNNLPQLIAAAIQIVISLTQGLMNALPQLLAEVPQIIMTIITGIVNSLPTLIAAVPQIIVSIIMGIINALPQLILAAPKIIMALITGIIGAIPQLLLMGPQILTGIWDGLKSQDWGAIGGNLVKGIWQGIQDAAAWFTSNITSFFSNIVGGVKKILGINSPSTVFADIGGNLMKGLANGISGTKKLVNDQISDVTDSVSNIQGSVSVKSAVSGAPSNAITPVASSSCSSPIGLDATNALISAINMIGDKIVSALKSADGAQVSGDISLDGISIGRAIIPYFLKELRRLGMIDSKGYIKVATA